MGWLRAGNALVVESMSDYSELKRLAETATPGEWHTDDPWIVYAQIDGKIIYLANTEKLDVRRPQSYSNAEFIAAANPAAVRALITENERLLKTEHGMIDGDLARYAHKCQQERDQLKAENEALRKAISWAIQVRRDPELEHEIRHEEWLEDLESAMSKDGKHG